jgi:hypothetical protein
VLPTKSKKISIVYSRKSVNKEKISSGYPFKCLDYVKRENGEGSGLWKLSKGHKWPLRNSLSTHGERWGGGEKNAFNKQKSQCDWHKET